MWWFPCRARKRSCRGILVRTRTGVIAMTTAPNENGRRSEIAARFQPSDCDYFVTTTTLPDASTPEVMVSPPVNNVGR